MKASELRIGNYVYFEHGKNEVELLKFDFDMGWNMEYIKPIPLTEEWLLRFGFENKLDIDNGTYHTIVFEKDGISLLFFMGDFNDCQINGDLDVDLSYVHTLQNLWYILTKQELTLKNND